MKILITGAKGFIARNLISELRNHGYNEIYEYDIETPLSELCDYVKDCDFVYHLAGVNRPKKTTDFMEGNYGFTSQLLDMLKRANNRSPIMISSSIQAELENPYGVSKREGEKLLIQYSNKYNIHIYIYRFPNVYGKWSRPNYNSVVSTFCYNATRDIALNVNDRGTIIELVYIDDLVNELILLLTEKKLITSHYYKVPIVNKITVGELADLISQFENSRRNNYIIDFFSDFKRKLYSTYTSYIPEEKLSIELKMHNDNRGSFTEMFKTLNSGQFSVNIAKKGIVKGNHWHHSKTEKFVVVSGTCEIKLRKKDSSKVVSYIVSSNKLEIIDIPCGYVHNITNIGNEDSVTVMWVNEVFDQNKPDTFYEEV